MRVNDKELEQLRVVAQDYLDGVAEWMRKHNIVVQTAVVLAPPAEAILRHAHRNIVDLIAMSMHGRSGVRRLLLGSVADKVLHRSTTSIKRSCAG